MNGPETVKPSRGWKLFEVEGWQLLVYVEADQDDGDRWSLVMETAVEGFGLGSASLKLGSNREDFATKLFESFGPENAKAGLTQLLSTLSALLGPDEAV